MSILNKIIENLIRLFEIVKNIDIIGKLIIVVLLILSIYFFKDCSGEELNDLQVEVEQTTEKVKTLSDSIQKLDGQVADKETTITKLKIEISLMQKQREPLIIKQRKLEEIRSTTIDTVTIIQTQDELIGNLKEQVQIADNTIAKKDEVITERESQIVLLQTSNNIANTQVDLLQNQLDNVMNSYKKETKLLGFIPKPTRKAAFIGGAAAGVITGIIIAK